MSTRCVALNKTWPHRRCKKRTRSAGNLCHKHLDGGWRGNPASTRRKTGSSRRSPNVKRSRKRSASRKLWQVSIRAMRRSWKGMRRSWEERRQQKRRAQRKKQERDQKRIKTAATFCQSTVRRGVVRAAACKVSQYATDETWNELSQSWSLESCNWFADVAMALLETQTWPLSRMFPLPWHKTERRFIRQLYDSIPLAGDETFVATARGSYSSESAFVIRGRSRSPNVGVFSP